MSPKYVDRSAQLPALEQMVEFAEQQQERIDAQHWQFAVKSAAASWAIPAVINAAARPFVGFLSAREPADAVSGTLTVLVLGAVLAWFFRSWRDRVHHEQRLLNRVVLQLHELMTLYADALQPLEAQSLRLRLTRLRAVEVSADSATPGTEAYPPPERGASNPSVAH